MSGESEISWEGRKLRQAQRSPELGISSPRELFDVDTWRRKSGQAVSQAMQLAEGLFVRPSASSIAKSVANRVAPGSSLAGDLLPHLDRPRGALFAAAEETGGAPMPAFNPATYRGAARGFADPGNYGMGDILRRRGMGDESVVGNLSARDIIGGVADLTLDPLNLAGAGVAKPTLAAAGEGALRLGFGRPAAAGALRSEVVPGAGETLAAAKKLVRALKGQYTDRELRRATTLLDEAAANRAREPLGRVREILQKALGDDVVNALGPRATAQAASSPAVEVAQRAPRPLRVVPEETGAARLGPTGLPISPGRAAPQGAQPLGGGNQAPTPTRTAAQRAAQQGREITSGLQQPELSGPFGTAQAQRARPADPLNFGNRSTGMATSEIRQTRAQRLAARIAEEDQIGPVRSGQAQAIRDAVRLQAGRPNPGAPASTRSPEPTPAFERMIDELDEPDDWWVGGAQDAERFQGSVGGSLAERYRRGQVPADLVTEAKARRKELDRVIGQIAAKGGGGGKEPPKTLAGKLWWLTDALNNTSRFLSLGGEFSMVTRQGGRLYAGHPIASTKAVLQSLPTMANREAWDALHATQTNSLAGRIFQASGGFVRSMDGALSEREERYVGKLASKVPIYSHTERFNTAFLNGQAIESFRNILKSNWEHLAPGAPAFEQLEKSGAPIPERVLNMPEIKRLARVLSISQGRGDIGEINQALPVLNAGFLAPLWRVSRLQLAGLDAKSLADLGVSPLARRRFDPVSKEVAKNAVAYYGAGMGLLYGLAQTGVGSVGVDPRASNFGIVKIGPMEYDIWGGQSQIARMIAQEVTGTAVSRTGNERDIEFGDAVLNWLRGGLGFVAGTAVDAKIGTTLGGDKFTIEGALRDRGVPIIVQDIKDAAAGERASFGGAAELVAGAVLPAAVGVGVRRVVSATDEALNKLVPEGDFRKASYEEQKAALESRPDLAKKLEEGRATMGGTIGEVEELRAEYSKSQSVADTKLENEDMDRAEWYKDTGEREKLLGVEIARKYREAGSRGLAFAAEPDDKPDDWYARVIAANTNPDDPTGRDVNWDAVERWRASLTDAQDRYIDEHTNMRTLSPEAAKRTEFKRELRKTGFWDNAGKAWEVMRKHPTLEKYESYDDYERAVRLSAVARFPDNAPESVKLSVGNRAVNSDPLVKAYRNRANLVEMPWVGKNPQLADQAAAYGVFKPTQEQTAMIAFKLRGEKAASGD